ncbi:Fur family transcriptional regulator [Actinomyces bovis]|nr:Fur family transcriptional regulator [Actinomyces bovis]
MPHSHDHAAKSHEAASAQARPRTTRQRSAVADILSRTEEFRSAQQIHAALSEEGTKVGLATVYRTLAGMAEVGEVDQVRNTDGETLYRRCEAATHHHHVVCHNCGRTVEVSGGALEAWIAEISAETGYTGLEHTAEFFGLCPECSAKES